MIHQPDEIGIVVEMRELRLDVPVVHVHGHRAKLVRGEHGLKVFDPVLHLQSDMVSRTNATRRKRVSEPVRPRVELRVGAPDDPRHDGLALGHGIGDALVQLSQVVGHEPMVDPTPYTSQESKDPLHEPLGRSSATLTTTTRSCDGVVRG